MNMFFCASKAAGKMARRQSGFSYHLATDRELMTIELPVELNTASAHELQLALDVDKILSGAKTIQLTDATDTTHSRANDALANQLHDKFATRLCHGKSDVPC